MPMGKQTLIKIILQLIRGEKTVMDPINIKEAKKYGIEFETEPGEFTLQKVKKIIINLNEV